MPFDITAFPSRPSVSVDLNRGHSLAGGLLYAAQFGIARGFGLSADPSNPPQFAARNLVTGRLGQINGPVTAANISQGLPAGNIQSDNAAGALIDIEYPNVNGASLGAQCSIFLVVRLFQLVPDQVIFGWKDSISPTANGMSIVTTGVDAWGCVVSNGVTQQRADTDPGTRLGGPAAWQTVSASYDSVGSTFNTFVSGIASPAAPPAATISGSLGTPTRGRVFETVAPVNAQVAIGYVWNRKLTRTQVLQLHADPFLLFKPKEQSHAYGLGRMTRPMA